MIYSEEHCTVSPRFDFYLTVSKYMHIHSVSSKKMLLTMYLNVEVTWIGYAKYAKYETHLAYHLTHVMELQSDIHLLLTSHAVKFHHTL